MKEIFDRHAEELRAAERRAIWRRISGSRAGTSRPRLRLALSAAAAMAAAAVITFAVVHREPAAPTRSDPASSDGSAQRAARVPSHEDVAGQGAGRGHAVLPEVRGGVDASSKSLANADRPPARHHEAPMTPIARNQGTMQAVPDSAVQMAAVPGARQPTGTASWDKFEITGVVTDAQHTPVPFANVVIPSIKAGTMTDENGRYALPDVPTEVKTLQVAAIGYARKIVPIEGRPGTTVTMDVDLGESGTVKLMEEIAVRAEKRIDTMSSTTKQSVTAEKLKTLPVDNLSKAVATKAGVVAQGGELHYRGGRSGEVGYQLDNLLVGSVARALAPPQPPVIPTTGGTTLPNDEVYDSMFFRHYGVNPFIPTDEDSLSTFAVDVDAASYTLMRRYVELGHLPPAEAVRVEEFVNFFPQGYPKFEDDDFRILVDGAPSPFGRGYQLLRIGVKGREIRQLDRKPAQLTFVVDVSGSMAREDRLELVKRALRLLVDQLRDNDRIGIVVFGSQARILLEPTALGGSLARAGGPSDDAVEEERGDWRGGRSRILEAIGRLQPEGSTNTEEGLLLGYRMARREFRPGAINRIVLCSDGVANVGRTGPKSILERVRTEADRGIRLSTIGFGMGNYNDVLMEQLADRGDGNYYYVDDLGEARRVLVENLTGTLQTIAKDAKIQVEFHGSQVLRYRLLGFENRDVADRDFRNDKVDAGEIGAGHEVTALYEVKLAPGAGSGPMAIVRLRYARPESEDGGAPQVREIEKSFSASRLARRFEDASPRLRLDAAVAEFAEILRGSYWAKDSRLSDVLPVARSAARGLKEKQADEFVELVEKAVPLSRTLKPEERRDP